MMKSLTYYMKLKVVTNLEPTDFSFLFQAYQYLCNEVERQILTSISWISQCNTR